MLELINGFPPHLDVGEEWQWSLDLQMLVVRIIPACEPRETKNAPLPLVRLVLMHGRMGGHKEIHRYNPYAS